MNKLKENIVRTYSGKICYVWNIKYRSCRQFSATVSIYLKLEIHHCDFLTMLSFTASLTPDGYWELRNRNTQLHFTRHRNRTGSSRRVTTQKRKATTEILLAV